MLEEYRQRARVDPDGNEQYVVLHAPRYRFLIGRVADAIATLEHPRILDVGHSWEADALRRLFPRAVVDTLGFGDSRFPTREGEREILFDLNDAQEPARWPPPSDYDLVIAAEVIEHVHTAPELVFRCLASQLRPKGALIVQTPNAAALPHRVELLFGRNPFERIRLDPTDAGHYREYTVDELLAIGGGAGLAVVDWTVQNYFAPVRPFARMYTRVAPLLPPRLRAGITIRYVKAQGGGSS